MLIDQKSSSWQKNNSQNKEKAPQAQTLCFPPIKELRVHWVHTLAGTTGSFELQEDNEQKASSERQHVGRHFCHLHSPLQSKKKVRVNTQARRRSGAVCSCPHTPSPAAPACPPPTLFLSVAPPPPPPPFSLYFSPPTISRRWRNISPFSPLFPLSPRGYCLPLSAAPSAACDQTGESQCASEGPAEGEAPVQSCNATFPPTGRVPE